MCFYSLHVHERVLSVERKKGGKGHILFITAARICEPHLAHLCADDATSPADSSDVTSPADSSKVQVSLAKHLPPSFPPVKNK